MKKRKILIASAAFFPENSPRAFRATELAKEFAKQNHEVTVITVDRGLALEDFCKRQGIQLKVLAPLLLQPIQVKGNFFSRLLLRIINRACLQLIEYPDIELMFKYRKVLKKETGYDLLISIAMPYPVHWGVAWARRSEHRIAKVWVADCGDPYMGNKADSFRRLFYFKYIEKWFSKKADYLAITNINMKDNYYPEFHSKIFEITQGFNFEESRKTLPAYKPNRIPTFAYAGTFIEGSRDPRALLDYLVKLPCDFKFYIYSDQRNLVEPFLANANGRIELIKPIPRTELLPVLARMDFLINISYDVKVQSPSKLVDYYIVGRPVLALQSNKVTTTIIDQFFKADYTEKFPFTDYEKFRIQHVCDKFLAFAE